MGSHERRERMDMGSYSVPSGKQDQRSSSRTAWLEPDSAGTSTWYENISNNLDNGIGLVIFINSVVIGLETDLGSQHFLAVEHVFFAAYAFEMVVRVRTLGIRGYLTSSWFDAVLLLMGFFD